MTKSEKVELVKKMSGKEALEFANQQMKDRKWSWVDQRNFWTFWNQLHPEVLEQKNDTESDSKVDEYVDVTLAFKPQESQNLNDFDGLGRYIEKHCDKETAFVFNLIKERPWHKDDIYRLLREKFTGLENWHELRRLITEIRKMLASNMPEYHIPDGKPGQPAIYQIVKTTKQINN